MSFKLRPVPDVPDQTAQVARAAFPKGHPYLLFRDELGPIFSNEDFVDLFPSRGQPAYPPWRLALITIMQFREKLTDRQAADAVRARIDWKYLLGLELTDSGFDFSVLSEFRGRLIEGSAQELLLDKLLVRLKEAGVVKTRGNQRTGSTHVLSAVRRLNKLELVAETMRASLNKLATVAPEWLSGHGLRQTRYRGVNKTHLGHVATAAAINLDRYFYHRTDRKKPPSRVSRFAALAA